MDRLASACGWLLMTVTGALAICHAVLKFTLDLLVFLTHQRSASQHSQHLCDVITDGFRSLWAEFTHLSALLDRYLMSINQFVAFLAFFVVVLPLTMFVLLLLGFVLLIADAIIVAAASAICLVVDVIVIFTRENSNVAEPPPQPAINFEDLPGNKRSGSILLILVIILGTYFGETNRKLGGSCRSDANCMSGLSCCNWDGCVRRKCVQTTVASPFDTIDTSLPFNKYAFLTTHNSFSITGVTRLTFYNQEDSVTDQLNNGVRALMLDVYDFRDDIWLCHSLGGTCYDLTAFEPAIYTLREVEAFLLRNPSEIVTLILEDHVSSHQGLTKLFNMTGLGKYWFPVQNMPQKGEDWPIVSDMIKHNHRLLVFTSNRSKESAEGIAYQWNYMVENQYMEMVMAEWTRLRVTTAPNHRSLVTKPNLWFW